MTRKKEDAAFQVEIETQEEWEDMLTKEGVTVVDVYAEWCGPCKGMNATLRRIKNEIGDDFLKFALAKSDTVDSLENYRNKSEPCFLFYAGGVLVSVIRGANCPLIIRTIKEQLAHERKVLEGLLERKEIHDLVISATPDPDKKKGFEDRDDQDREMTVCIIKPDAVRNGLVGDILHKLEEENIDVVHHEERLLSEDEARDFYSHLANESYFEEYITFMTSGPTHVLLLAHTDPKENIIKNFRDLLGPTSVEEAKDAAPESLRAKFGTGEYMNALHGSDSPETAAREMAFFFPSMGRKASDHDKPQKQRKIQRTLAIIRPDVLANHKDDIIKKIEEAGFRIALQKEVQLTKEQAAEFYKEHANQDYFDELTDNMSSGPLLALGLAREDAISKWREFIGPKDPSIAKEVAPDSLRAQFPSEAMNAVHGATSVHEAAKELEFFFPEAKTIAAIKPDAMGTKEEIIRKIHDAGFKIAARKETKLTRDIAETFYADQKDTEHFEDLIEHMISGDTYFMVLTREDAVEGWRQMVGPTDPHVARSEDPNTLRALFGTDRLHNAIHGSVTTDQVEDGLRKIFSNVDLSTIYTEDYDLAEVTETKAPGPQGQESGYQDGRDGEGPAANQPLDTTITTDEQPDEFTNQEPQVETEISESPDKLTHDPQLDNSQLTGEGGEPVNNEPQQLEGTTTESKVNEDENLIPANIDGSELIASAEPQLAENETTNQEMEPIVDKVDAEKETEGEILPPPDNVEDASALVSNEEEGKLQDTETTEAAEITQNKSDTEPATEQQSETVDTTLDTELQKDESEDQTVPL